MRRRAWIGMAGAVIVLAGLAGCSGSGERIVYEVIASGAGAKVTYAETVGGFESMQTEKQLDEATWTEAPAVNMGTTTPYVSVTPPPGGAVRCRILLLNREGVAVVEDEIGRIGEDVECAYKR